MRMFQNSVIPKDMRMTQVGKEAEGVMRVFVVVDLCMCVRVCLCVCVCVIVCLRAF